MASHSTKSRVQSQGLFLFAKGSGQPVVLPVVDCHSRLYLSGHLGGILANGVHRSYCYGSIVALAHDIYTDSLFSLPAESEMDL
jgi:hypothetical protein